MTKSARTREKKEGDGGSSQRSSSPSASAKLRKSESKLGGEEAQGLKPACQGLDKRSETTEGARKIAASNAWACIRSGHNFPWGEKARDRAGNTPADSDGGFGWKGMRSKGKRRLGKTCVASRPFGSCNFTASETPSGPRKRGKVSRDSRGWTSEGRRGNKWGARGRGWVT